MVRGTLAPSQICEVLLQPTLQMLGIGPRPCACDTSASSSSKPHRLARVCEPRSLALARGLAKFLFYAYVLTPFSFILFISTPLCNVAVGYRKTQGTAVS